jgi:serine/threonine protein phosphatase PrpC
MAIRVVASGLSDIGRARSHNEDSYLVDLDLGLFVVADGMGGHQHGEVASRLAVDSILQSIQQPRQRRRRSAEGPQTGQASELLSEAVAGAHDYVLNAIQEDVSLLGMGTTVVAMLVHDDGAIIAHVGDSRAYRLEDGGMQLLTEDHTWVREQVSAGHLSERQAREHPLRNVVTQALGGTGEVAVEVSRERLRPGQLYLLCSDGLTSMLEDDEIEAFLTSDGSLDQMCRELVQAANQNGGLDNITVILVQVLEEDAPLS